MKRQVRKSLPDNAWGRAVNLSERVKAGIRAKVEHPFHIIKNLFGHRKVRYRGLAKNDVHLVVLFGLANLIIARKRLLPSQWGSVS
jgi:IS5 family transposase